MCLKHRKHVGEHRQGRAVSSQLKRSSVIDSPLARNCYFNFALELSQQEFALK